jgi:hypothetical protein
MGIAENVRKNNYAFDAIAELQKLQQQFEEKGISADMDVEMTISDGRMQPVVKNIRLRTGDRSATGVVSEVAIEDVAKADAGNISEVAASQLKISNDYYDSVLGQARQSFRAAIIAAGVGLGFFLAALGFALALGKLDVAIISSISGSVVEVIAGLNFWLFGKTAAQLDLFHVRLEQTQRFLLANSVCANLRDDARDTARSELVKSFSAKDKIA